MNLRERIISGRLHAGQFLRIDAIAKELSVSTTPVREGLLLLQSESFVRLMPRRGFVVNSFNRSDLRDLFWAQAVIGGELAGRAARRISQADLERLQELHATHERSAATGDTALGAQVGHQFHRTINLAAESPRLALLLGSLTRQLPNRFYAGLEGALQHAVGDHRVILDALRLGTEDAARALMHRHILSGADYLIAALERQGSWGEPDARVEERPRETRSGRRKDPARRPKPARAIK